MAGTIRIDRWLGWFSNNPPWLKDFPGGEGAAIHNFHKAQSWFETASPSHGRDNMWATWIIIIIIIIKLHQITSNYMKLHEITSTYMKLHEIMHQFIRIHTHQWENSTWFDHSAFVSCPVCCLLVRLELRKDILPQLQPVGRGNCWGRKTYLLQPPDVRNKLEVSMMLMGKSCIHGDCTWSVFH